MTEMKIKESKIYKRCDGFKAVDFVIVNENVFLSIASRENKIMGFINEFTAEELESAAKTFNEIAEYLRER